MNPTETFSRVQRTIAETLGAEVSSVLPHTRVKEDLGADSMQVITIIIALDDEFDTEFNTDELPREGVTVEWIANFVARAIGQKV